MMPCGKLMPPSWDLFLAEVESRIDQHGYWGGEALSLRDAAGRKRLGATGGRLVVAALNDAGYEVELEFGEPLRSESERVIIRRAGGRDLAKTIEALLPAIREADGVVPANAMWRDAVVAQYALRAWRGRTSNVGPRASDAGGRPVSISNGRIRRAATECDGSC